MKTLVLPCAIYSDSEDRVEVSTLQPTDRHSNLSLHVFDSQDGSADAQVYLKRASVKKLHARLSTYLRQTRVRP